MSKLRAVIADDQPMMRAGFKGNKTLLLLAKGLLAKQGLRNARREGRASP